MSEKTEVGALDLEAIREAARIVPRFTDDEAGEAAAYAERLRGYVEQLLAAVDVSPQPVGVDAASERKARKTLTDWARDTLRSGEPDGPFYIENLAVHCRLLAGIAAKAGDRIEFCCWCHTYRTGTRVIQSIETGSGPGAALSACPRCRDAHDLTPLSDRPPAAA